MVYVSIHCFQSILDTSVKTIKDGEKPLLKDDFSLSFSAVIEILILDFSTIMHLCGMNI